ncbi:helix-turn-helix domain-containing protein [Rossellomorea sp. GAMAL-10_SWC]
MNRFDERHASLIYFLFEKNDWCSLANLSEKTGYSRSTIWRDITFLNSALPKGWFIEKSETEGARLIKSPNGTLEGIWSYMKNENPYFQILEYIILNNGVTINEISTAFHISRSTVYRQLDQIKEVVEEAGITLDTSPLKLSGDEKKVRRFMMQYLEYKGLDYLNDLNNIDLKNFRDTIVNYTTELSITLHLGAIQRLSFILEIINIRISMECYVSFSKDIYDKYKNTLYFDIAKKMFPFMEKCPTREQQTQEILYFCLCLLSEVMPNNMTEELYKIRIKMKENREDPRVLFLNVLSDYLHFDLAQDDDFLYKYFSTIKRTKYDTQFYTDTRMNTALPFLPYVEEHPLFIGIGNLVKKHLENETMSYGKLEILELFLLVEAFLIRKKNGMKINTVLICRTYIEMDYLYELLDYHFGKHLVIKIYDLSDIDVIKRHNHLDLVISTLKGQFLKEHLPVLKISTFPTEAELSGIRKFINQYFTKRLYLHEILPD